MMRVCAYLGAVEGGWGADAPRMWIPPFSTLDHFHQTPIPHPGCIPSCRSYCRSGCPL